MEFPICPCVLNCWAALPLSPVERHVAAGNRVLGSGGDHELVGDRDPCVGSEDLALLLFACVDGQWEAGVDADIELGHVVVQVGLADLGVRGQDVLDQRAEVNAVELGGPAGEFLANIFYPSRIPKKNPSANNHKKQADEGPTGGNNLLHDLFPPPLPPPLDQTI